MSLSVQALDAALRPVSDLLEAHIVVPAARIPVTAHGWAQCLYDADLEGLVARMAAVQASFEALPGPTVTYLKVRAAATEARQILEPVLASVETLAAFAPSGGTGARLTRAVLAVVEGSVSKMRSACAARAGPSPADVTSRVDELASVVVELLDLSVPSAGLWTDFGVNDDTVSGWPSAVACARLLDAYHGRYDDLSERLAAVMEPVSSTRIDLVKEARLVLSLLESPCPLITLRTARAVKALVVDAFDAEPDRTGAFLVDLLTRVGRSYENQQAAGKVRALLTTASGPRERSVLELDLYRRMAEGQLRPWAWTIVRLLRGSASGRVPEMGPLREMLLGAGHWLATDAARHLWPEARNAAAHEDYSWNSESQRLEFDGGSVDEHDLRAATFECYAFMCGAEIGWAYARAERPALGAVLDVDPGPSQRSILNSSTAPAHFGSNGILLQRFDASGCNVSATVSGLSPQTVNSCFQAMLWVSESMPGHDAVEVLVADHDGSLLVRREAFELTSPLWLAARGWFDYMPPTVFLPADIDNRLRVETHDEAAAAAIWFTTNAALTAYGEFEDTADTATGLCDLGRKLRLAEQSLHVTAALLRPEPTRALTHWPLRLLGAAAMWAESAESGGNPAPLLRLQGRIEAVHDKTRTPTVMPTLWPDLRVGD